MKNYTSFVILLWFISINAFAQQLHTRTPDIDKTFDLAVGTLLKNTQDSLIKAGGAYGGEWTRDISINSWNAASMLLPKEAAFSLWSVTNNRTTIGAEYWDKIIWVVAAYKHYLVNNDIDFLRQAYICSANTMTEMENSVFDRQYGLFQGPSVFNDGVAGYEEPIYESSIDQSYIIKYSASEHIKCLSTNCVYYEAYNTLTKMATLFGEKTKAKQYKSKAETLKKQIRTHLFDSKKGWLNYLIDQNGKVHPHQEGLGISFAILFDVVNKEEAAKIISQVYVSKYGLPSVYPIFKRFSEEKPGRHNAMIWPFVNAFWADACYKAGRKDIFETEYLNLANLTINKGNQVFYEIHNATTGAPDGGNQAGQTSWVSVHDQTWSATGFLRMTFADLFGMDITSGGMKISPDFSFLQKLGFTEIKDIPYRSAKITIRFSGSGNQPVAILKNGKEVKEAVIDGDEKGAIVIEYIFQDSLQLLNLPGVTISLVENISGGTFTPPAYSEAIGNLPEFVRVAAVAKPTPESNIRIEVWLPKDWNGRFLVTGNGGGAGEIPYWSLADGIRHGFAVGETDMGTSPHVDSLVAYPARWEDFGHRATHEMVVVSKAVIEKYYGKLPLYSYFVGCSTGGEQSLSEAQRYPDDFDGIIAGAPANNRTHLHAGFLWNYKIGTQHPEHQFTREQVASITKAVIAANVGKDGGYPGDNFLTDPRMATFNPEVLDTLLTQEQIKILKQFYAGPVNPVTGEPIYTPIPLGSESAGAGLYDQQGEPIRYHHYPFRWVYGLDFDAQSFDFDKDLDKVDSILAPILNANNPDLEPLRSRGGKLIMYTGLADPLVPYQDALHYYERVIEAQGSLEKTQSFFRFFLVPGVEHCGGGQGPCYFGQWISDITESSESNLFTSLVQWVEKGIAPEQIIATAYNEGWSIHFQRPIYPYPKFPHYIEGEDPALPSGYRGVDHERGLVVIPAARYLK